MIAPVASACSRNCARGLSLALCLIATWALPCSRALAFRTATDSPGFENAARVAWEKTDLSFGLTGPLPANLNAAAVDMAAELAFAAWTSPACTSLTVTRAAGSTADITLEWVDRWAERGLDAQAMATTELRYVPLDDSDWEIAGARILINASGFSWVTEENLSTEIKRDLRAVLTHEIGHALGLIHVCENDGRDGAPLCGRIDGAKSHVMYPGYRGSEQRFLSEDDSAGICALFPKDGCAEDVCATDPTDARAPPGLTAPSKEGKAVGSWCAAASDCTSNYCAERGVCSSLCGSTSDCPLGFFCDFGERGELLCLPRAGVFGEACEAPSDCVSNLCVAVDELRVCTERCDDREDCPDGFACTSTGTESTCAPERASSSCSLTNSQRTRGHGLWALFVLLLTLAFRRGAFGRSRFSMPEIS